MARYIEISTSLMPNMTDEVTSTGSYGSFHGKGMWHNSRCQLFQANVRSFISYRSLRQFICVITRCGGDTEVDVNDVGYALEKVINTRKAEDTWQVDSFGGVPVKSRTPDEVMSACCSGLHFLNTYCIGHHNVP
jgi:hypothetical protein